MNTEEYIKEFKHFQGYRNDYYPKDSYETVANWLDDELKLQMPTDTAAREVEGDAVMLLVDSGEPEAIEIGKNLGDIMSSRDTTGDFKYRLLRAMKQASDKLHELSRNI